MTIEIIFGEILKQYRIERGLSQEELALSINLDRTYISMLERGKRQPTISSLFAIAEGLNIKPSDLIKELEKRYTKPNDE
ncbi:helix-turn-helix domain-containing protein [Paenibacillus flagellatus]|uniref:XRE family transcriptional regulator n=1 Tax=Paenibacillus flagellatus TaxID=2211139 RepID=A0A2V5K3M6_9BACL|nr:helix-turn-helix transcriptional regulator [Paenibacillus flagellatus]PYI52444.1 XRE family transcriptional regulator [Paenibacillus flagellatus]